MRNVHLYLSALMISGFQSKALASDPSTLPDARACQRLLSHQEVVECLGSVTEKLELILPRYVEAKRAAILRYPPAERKNDGEERAALFAMTLEQAARSLERAQAAWLTYRDAPCDMVAKLYLDGTGAADGWATCLIDLTMGRIRELWSGPGSGLPDPN
jgi:uncharacterized protein YecT (DUF1311 family)